mgnify:CR=1 FL=1
MAQTTTSPTGTLDLKDLGKGLLVAVITPVFTILIQSLQEGSLTFNWKAIGATALAAGLAYLMKNWLSPGTVVLPATKEEIKAVKEGDAEVVINKN